jgi:hypothetical protein
MACIGGDSAFFFPIVQFAVGVVVYSGNLAAYQSLVMASWVANTVHIYAMHREVPYLISQRQDSPSRPGPPVTADRVTLALGSRTIKERYHRIEVPDSTIRFSIY